MDLVVTPPLVRLRSIENDWIWIEEEEEEEEV